MTSYIALLRGINVGGHNRVPMPQLRTILEGLGHAEVATYLQSGNAVFTSDATDEQRLADDIRQGIADDLGLDIAVLVRTADEVAAIAAANPFATAAAENPKFVHAVFLSADPDPERVAALDPTRYAPDEYRIGSRVIYVHYPNGAGRSKLDDAVWRRLGVTATARNWNTVTKLLTMTSPAGG